LTGVTERILTGIVRGKEEEEGQSPLQAFARQRNMSILEIGSGVPGIDILEP
jgi:hypothetical protein